MRTRKKHGTVKNISRRLFGAPMQGSISVFLAYLLVFLLAVVFALLEVSRVWALEQRTSNDAIMTGNSLLAEYSTELWDDYGLLFLDGSYGQEQFSCENVEQRGLEFSMENLDVHGAVSGTVPLQSWNLYGLYPANLQITGYGLATDQGGRAFRKEAVRAIESRYTTDMLQQLYQLIVDREETNPPVIEVEETDMQVQLSENPIAVVDQMKQLGVLNCVVGGTEISNKSIDLSQTLQKRSLVEGTFHYQEKMDWREKLLFRQYLQTYYSCYVDEGNANALDYEMEYLVAGKASDKENLRAVVNRLLIMREVANISYLQTDIKKQEMILAAASALAGATMSPELIPAYKKGIMAAWAYAESVSDIKLLLAGEKVKVVKTEEQWNTDLMGLRETETNIKQSQGLNYQEYLQMLLWTTTDTNLSYRGMDLIEANTGCDMNAQIYRLEGELQYRGQALFSSLITMVQGHMNDYAFQQEFVASYIEE